MNPEIEEMLNNLSMWENHRVRRRFYPWYDPKADYNTNAKSYYDYLARFQYDAEQIKELVSAIASQLDKQKIQPVNTDTIENDIVYDSDSQSTYQSMHALMSSETSAVTVTGWNGTTSTIALNNALKDLSGLYSPDYTPFLNNLYNMAGQLMAGDITSPSGTINVTGNWPTKGVDVNTEWLKSSELAPLQSELESEIAANRVQVAAADSTIEVDSQALSGGGTEYLIKSTQTFPANTYTLSYTNLATGDFQSGSFTLSEPLDNFDYVEVHYHVAGGQYSTMIAPGYFAASAATGAPKFVGWDYDNQISYFGAISTNATSNSGMTTMVINNGLSAVAAYTTGNMAQAAFFNGETSTAAGTIGGVNYAAFDIAISQIRGVKVVSF